MSWIIFGATFALVFFAAKRTGRSPWFQLGCSILAAFTSLVVFGFGSSTTDGVVAYLVTPTIYAIVLFLNPAKKEMTNV